MKKLGISLVAVATLITGLLNSTPALAADPVCTINVTSNDAQVQGTGAGDVICITANHVVVNALGGDDTVIDNGVGNVINLGDGNDTYDGTGGSGSTVNGGDGNDVITGTPGEDTLSGDTGDDTIIGGSANDVISGGDGNDNLSGGPGNDSITGEAGDDTLNGDAGNDFLSGGAGDDTLIGGAADDTLRGGDGNDNLSGNAGQDNIFGESGTDTLEGNQGDDVLSGGPGVDQVGRQEVLDSYGLNKCDYTNQEVKHTETCIYDDTPPSLDEFTWDKSSYEVGSADASAILTLTSSDDQGVGSIWVNCYGNGSDVNPVSMYLNADNGIWSVSGTGSPIKKSQVVNSHSVRLQIQMNIPLGTKPGSYQCAVQVRDLLDHYAYENGGALTVTRAPGNFDDDAPVMTAFAWDSPSGYEVGAQAGAPQLSFHLADATGARSFTVSCWGNGNMPSPVSVSGYYDSNSNHWSVWGYNNPTLNTQINNNTSADFSITASIRQGFKPGTYQCNLWSSDVNNHNMMVGLPALVITRAPGTYDDDAPVVSNFNFDSNVYDVGASSVQAQTSLTVTDTTGVNYFQVYCQDNSPFPNPVSYTVTESGSNWSVYGSGSPFIVSHSGDEHQLTLTVESTLTMGAHPGTLPCYAYTRDTYEQYAQTQIGSITIARTPPGMPSAPSGLTFTPTAGRPNEGTLSWTAPSFLGSPALSDYQIDYSSNGNPWRTVYKKDGKSAATSYHFDGGLLAGTDYQFRVRGENGGGFIDGSLGAAWSDTLETRTLDPLVPDAPTTLTAKNITRSGAALSWTAPAFNGGAPITDFLIETSRDGITWNAIPNRTASTSVNFTVGGLAPGTNYQVRVAAVNRAGNSNYAVLAGGLTTLTAPATKPRNLRSSHVDGTTAQLYWDLPDSNGGAAITDYQVEVSGNGGTSWTVIRHTASNTPNFMVNALVKGKTYLFRVSAVTSLGLGAASDAITLTTLVSVPAAPTNLTLKSITSAGASLSWQMPTDNGGSPIYDFKLQVARSGTDNWVNIVHPESVTKTYNLSGLAPGTTYQVRVSAVNAAGYSPYLLGSFTTVATVPTAPQSLEVSNVRPTTLTLSWALPASNGGSNLSADYKVEVSSNCSTYTVIRHTGDTGLSFNVTNLSAGTKYCFRVSAQNSVGTSVPSGVVQVVTFGNVPNTPASLSVSAKTKNSIALGWATPQVVDGGKIRDYVVVYSTDQGTTWTTVRKTASTSTKLTVTGLRSATTYWFKVKAVNDVGESNVQENPLVVVTK